MRVCFGRYCFVKWNNLKGINLLKKRYKCAVRYSDHTMGDLASKVAVSLGATIIEKYFKVDRDKKSIDQHLACTQNS